MIYEDKSIGGDKFVSIKSSENKLNRIVITGATSTIGVAIINEAIGRGIEVLAVCNINSKKMARLPENKLVSVIESDISDYGKLYVGTPSPKPYDAFFHLAWLSSINNEQRDQCRPQAENVLYSLDAVNLAERLGCKVFVGSGSQAEYGRTEKVLTEELPPRPESAYGMAKLCAGQMTRMMCRNKGIRHIWPRILSVYGPCCDDHTVVQYTIKSLCGGKKPSLSGGDQVWDFLYSKDIACAMLALAQFGKDGEIYCVGSGHAEPLKNYLYKIRDVINPDLELGLGEIPYSDKTVMHLETDIAKLKHDTGFLPQYSFEQGIKETVNWYLALEN